MTRKQSDRPAYKRMHEQMKVEAMNLHEAVKDSSRAMAERDAIRRAAKCALIDRMTLDARAAMQGYLSSGAINKEPHHVAAVAWGHAREMAAMRAKVIKDMEG